MTETDDPNYFETQHGAGGDFSYGGGVPTGETKTSAPRPEDFEGFEPNEDEYGFPKETEEFGKGEQPLFSQEKTQFSTSRSLDAGFEKDNIGIGNMGTGRSAPLRSQSSTGYNELDTKDREPPGQGDYQDIGEDRGAGTSYAPPSQAGESKMNTSEELDTTEKAPSQTGKIGEGETKSNLISDITSKGGSVEESSNGLFSAAKDAFSMGTSEEELGAGLLAIPGIGEVLGGIMEGIGAITEAGAVGAGAYGAVQSMMSADQEEALRQKPLAPIRMPTLDLGGSIGVPLMS